MSGSEGRDVVRLEVPRVGALVAAVGDRVVPVRIVGPDGTEVVAVTDFFLELRANDASSDTPASYGKALLRWFRFLWAIDVPWDRASRVEARDFMVWLAETPKPARPRLSDAPLPGTVNAVTHKAYPGTGYAVRTRRHNRAVVRAFYEFHRDRGTGPMVNPMPDRVGVGGVRPDAHHNPMEPFGAGRRAEFQPKLPKRAPVCMPDELFEGLFAGMRHDRDRALLAFFISCAARASELLTVTCDRVDVGQQLIGVIRKGSRELQWLPASAEAFVWLARYRHGLGPEVTWRAGEPLWRTLRRPYRALTYPAARAVLVRANTGLGTNWTMDDLRHAAARRMTRDPDLLLTDVQWLLGHARLTSTQIYTEPDSGEVVERMRGHWAQLAEPRPPARPAAGYDPEVLRTLLGGAAL